MKIRFRYRVREIFCATALVAMLAAGFYWWRWWNYTRHMRDLSNAISASSLDRDSKLIIKQLAWSSQAWDSGLIQDLAGPTSIKHVVWKGKTTNGCEIYIFDSFVRPAADTPVAPLCVVFNKQKSAMAWERIAPYSSGFMRASMDEHDVLTVITKSNWFFGKGIYKYSIACQSIIAMDDGKFLAFDKEDHADNLPKLIPVDPVLKEMVERIKGRLN